MNEILNDLSDQKLIFAIQENLTQYWSIYGRSVNGEARDNDEMSWFTTDISNPLFNAVLRARFFQNTADEKIDNILNHFKARNLPMYWWLLPDSLPLDLGDRLITRGLTSVTGLVGMAVDLQELDREIPASKGLTIERVTDRSALKQWTHTAITGFDISDLIEDAFFAIESFQSPLRYYIGLLNGEPVATSLMCFGAGVAGLYWIAVVPEARGLGLGTALTIAPLLEARDMGYRTGILQASAMGYNLYRRIGFREYCKISRYIWRG